MTKTSATGELARTDVRAVLRTMKVLVIGYASISLCTLVAIVLLRDKPDLVTDAVWIRGMIVAATSLLMLSFATGTARGSSRSYLRLRIASGIMLIAIAVIIALPGGFPPWMKIEQGVCGLLLLGVVAVVNGRRIRSAFAAQ